MDSSSLLTVVERADARRRAQRRRDVAARVAPLAAAAVVAAAVLVRVVHGPLALVGAAVALGAAVVGVCAWMASRARPLDDRAARRLDDAAALGGELRSAHWFAQGASDAGAWTTFHVAAATARADAIDWAHVFPPPAVARRYALAAALTAAAAAVSLFGVWRWPHRATAPIDVATATASAPRQAHADVPPDVQKQIDDLLKAVQNGTMPMDDARAKLSQLRSTLAGAPLDAKTLAAAQSKSKSDDAGAKSDPSSQSDLAKKAERTAASAALPQDMKWMLQDLAKKLGAQPPQADAQRAAADEKSDAPAKAASNDMQQSGDGMQMMRAPAEASDGTQVMSSKLSMDGTRASAKGLQQANALAKAAPLDLNALKKESIAASEDTEGQNVLSELRRKSEQSHASVGYTHVAPLAAYDTSHAAAPPAPPAALRSLVQQYFIRR